MDRDSKRRHKHGHHSRRRSRSPRRHRRKSPPRQRTQHRKRSSSSLRSPEPEYYRRASWIVGRSRTRSPHPWIKILEGKESPKHQDDDPDTQLFWDGFQWVARSHALTGNMNRFLEETNKAKRVAISNIPFEFNITEKDVLDFITSKMFEFSLNDSGNKKPVVSVQADEEKPNQVIVQFSSLDEAKKAIRLGGIKLLGRPLSVGKPEEIAGKAGMGQMLGVNTHILDHLDSVETSARAAAVAASAI